MPVSKGRNKVRKTPLYRLWLNMRNRCNNPRGQDYRYYGGRGIRVCKRWDNYDIFATDVGPHPGKGWTFDRIDNDGDYCPSNVRWADRKTQARNRNYCRLSEKEVAAIRGMYVRGSIRQKDLATAFGVSQVTISHVTRGKTWR